MEKNKKKNILGAIILAICLGIYALMIVPVFIMSHTNTTQKTCLSNQKQIAHATLMWVQENNNEKMPSTDAWEVIDIKKEVLKCPKDKKYKKSGNSYVYNRAVAGQYLEKIEDPSNTILTADGERTTTYSTKANIAYSKDDLRYRHSDGILCSYVDGHAAYSYRGSSDPRIDFPYK